MADHAGGRVTYQAMLDGTAGRTAGRFVALGPGAVATRRRDAATKLTVRVSKPQAAWVREAGRLSGGAVDPGALVRALLDLGRELDVDWSRVGSGRELRDAVRDAVMVRRGGPQAER